MNAATALDYLTDPSGGNDLSWLPPGPHTIDVLDILPGDRRYEIVDGMLSILNVPTNRHQNVLGNLLLSLHPLLPDTGWQLLPAPGFSRDAFNYRVPDIAVCLTEAALRNIKGAYLQPAECCLLCEITDETAAFTDRVVKPVEYASTGVPYYLRVELNDSGRVVKLFLCENIENPHRDVESDPERVYKQIAYTMTGGAPLPLPKPFTGPLDPNGL
jgi:Uma2 family endonuclease